MQERGPIPGPETGLLPNTHNELSEETHVLTKQEILLGKGTWVEGSRVRGTWENCSATEPFYGLGFYVIRLASGFFSQSF